MLIIFHALVLLWAAFVGGEAALPGSMEIIAEGPVPPATSVKRIETTYSSFYACEQVDWRGECHWFQIIVGKCFDLSSVSWNDKISSFGPDPGYACFAHM